MTGIYKIREDKIGEMKGADRFAIVKVFLAIYVLFIIAAVLRKDDDDKLVTVAMVTAMFALIILVSLIISLFTKSPVYNTIIEITDQEIVRHGERLLHVQFAFDEIDRMISKDNGTILVKKGMGAKMDLYFNSYRYHNGAGIIFIPLAIDKYENILNHIKQRIK